MTFCVKCDVWKVADFSVSGKYFYSVGLKSRSQYGQFFFSSPRAIFQCRLLWGLYKLCVQSLGSVSVLALEIPHTDSYTIIWTHENTCMNR